MENSPSLPYQDKPDPWSSHSVIARWVNAMPPGSVILDVGTASGTLARMCRAVPARDFFTNLMATILGSQFVVLVKIRSERE